MSLHDLLAVGPRHEAPAGSSLVRPAAAVSLPKALNARARGETVHPAGAEAGEGSDLAELVFGPPAQPVRPRSERSTFDRVIDEAKREQAVIDAVDRAEMAAWLQHKRAHARDPRQWARLNQAEQELEAMNAR